MAKQYPSIVQQRTFKLKTAAEMERDAALRGTLKRTLGPFGLTMVGVGFMLGAGIFMAPGTIAVDMTGPAVCISYLIAALSAFLSCFCYAEFACDMPLAGAAYNYIAASLGEFFAWVVTSNLIFEYILADAAVIRGFAPYFATLIGKDPDFFVYTTVTGGKTYVMDWWAFAITLAMTAFVSIGAKESTTANTIITVIHLVVMAFIIIAGFTQADSANFHPFFPNDQPQQWKQVFNGAAIAFFSFIGFDAVATAAEEVKKPSKHMPWGILGSMSIVTVIYFLMCVVLCLMVPRDMINPDATFAAAFVYVGLPWASHIVALGALLGILTGILIGIYAPARILTGCCREGMLPPVLAWIGPKQTPWVATWVIGICIAVIALLTDFAELANMVSIGTFVVFWFVAVALLWRRMHLPGGVTGPVRWANQLLHLFAMIGFSLGFVLVWCLPAYNIVDGVEGKWYNDQWKWLLAMALCCLAVPVSMCFFCRPAYVPSGFKVPLYPFVPCGSIFVNTFLLGQLDEQSYKRFGWWTLAVVIVYLVYGIFAAQAQDNRRISCLPGAVAQQACARHSTTLCPHF
ncbi:hypothetical protein CHLRE_07g329050v5 [Chlamydomonas reinhardtii]|uniref:Cationic amino acid transporter C-terminal domain-containing protein n=1 Tax=Chlamydomonas reinhardtii TaxID=3055 RepID=A0A2K3DJT0_CHLRE|nr:uncharacterized protein CHLRE_07g329050v5 [Chlamydomonas reinhardtii]PNW80768.1 hypothetical protein CHLRE_07g329050v5 [Chlamydomonas reinhardtii]